MSVFALNSSFLGGGDCVNEQDGGDAYMFEKQFNHRTHETSLGPVDIEGPVTSQILATYTLDPGLTAFRQPAEQHEALVEIAALEEGRIIIVPTRVKEYSLDALLAGISADNIHDKADFGAPTGKELL